VWSLLRKLLKTLSIYNFMVHAKTVVQKSSPEIIEKTADKKTIIKQKELPLVSPVKKVKKTQISTVFLSALSILSILGFVGIISDSLFDFNLNPYLEAALMVIVGLALILEAQVSKLRTIVRGLTHENFSKLITVIIGIIAIFAGIFSLPRIEFTNPAFVAIKGILAVIAIVIIVIQSWVVGAKSSD
jgi:hypothetical protein